MTIILGAVGAAIGGATGGPAGARLGWAIGTTIGSVIEMSQISTPKSEAGKLSDLRFSGSQFAATIPRVWGKGRVGGNVIWAAEDANGNHLVEHSRKKSYGSGKSKVTRTEYWYSSTFAVAFCVGTQFMPNDSLVYRAPVIKRIWADDILIYDVDAPENIVTPTLYSGTESQSPDPVVIAAMGVNTLDAPAWRGICYGLFENLDLSDFGSRIPNFSAEIETAAVSVGNVYSDLVRSVGVDAGDIDISDAGESCESFLALATSDAQTYIDALILAYGYDHIEIDGVLRLVKRGGATTFALTADDIGAGSSNDREPYVRRRGMKTEIPRRIDVSYFDINADHQRASDGDGDIVVDQAHKLTIDLPMSLSADFALEIARRELDRATIESQTFTTSVLMRHSTIAPGDVGTIATRTGTKRVRVVRTTGGRGEAVNLELIPDDAGVMTQDGGGEGGGGSGGGEVKEVIPTSFIAFSGRELVDGHEQYPGFYVAASGPDGWQGCTVQYSADGGVSWIEGPYIDNRAVFGEATTILADP